MSLCQREPTNRVLSGPPGPRQLREGLGRRSHWERSRKPPGCSGTAHLFGVQNLEEWEKQGRHEGSDSQRDDFCAPVNRHEDDDVGTPDKLKRRH